MSAGGSVLAEVLGQLPAGEGEMVGLSLSRASKAPRSWRFWRRAVRSCGASCCYSERSPTDGDVRRMAELRRNGVSKGVGIAEIVLVTPVSSEGAGVLPIPDV